MTKFRVGHLVRLRSDRRRRGRILSANVNDPGHLGQVAVGWIPGGRVTTLPPHLLVLDDHPLRGRNVILEHAADDWMEDL